MNKKEGVLFGTQVVTCLIVRFRTKPSSSSFIRCTGHFNLELHNQKPLSPSDDRFHAHTIIPSVLLVFTGSHVVADGPGSQFDCAVSEFQPINRTCPGHHLLPALSSRWGEVSG